MVKTNNHPDRISILYIFIYAFFGNILSIGQIAFITMFLFMTITTTFVLVITRQINREKALKN